MKKLLIFKILILSSSVHASDFSDLYMSIKNKNICIYTNFDTEKNMSNEILIYIGKIEKNIDFKTSYSKTYKNVHHPNNEQHCLNVPTHYFQMNEPYEAWVEADKVYKRRFCLSNESNQIKLTEVVNGYLCGRNEYDYSGGSFFKKFLNWFNKFFYK